AILIGTIQTLGNSSFLAMTHSVSIPHRYDTNPKKTLINQHMEKLYNIIIYPFENSVNRYMR
ncbi:hypothetical protein H919_05084, partial [Anoxybacillus flavithermus AK1]